MFSARILRERCGASRDPVAALPITGALRFKGMPARTFLKIEVILCEMCCSRYPSKQVNAMLPRTARGSSLAVYVMTPVISGFFATSTCSSSVKAFLQSQST